MENKYWLRVTDYPDYEQRFFDDPTISTDETVEAIASAFDNPKMILEIGCGYGRLTSRIWGKFADSIVAGIDINPAIIQIASPGPNYYVADKIEGKWDAIYAVTVFQHLPDEKKRDYILQVGEHLRKGGVFRVQFIEGDRDNFIDHWVSLEKMQQWFAEAGLKITQTERLVHPEWTWITAQK